MAGVLRSLLYLLFFYKENDGDGFLKSRSGLFGKDHTLAHLQHLCLHPAEHNVQQLQSVSEGDLHLPPEVQPPTSARSGSARLHSTEGSGIAANTTHLRLRVFTSTSLFMHECHCF